MKNLLYRLLISMLSFTAFDLSAAQLRGLPLLEADGETFAMNIKYLLEPEIQLDTALKARIDNSIAWLDNNLVMSFNNISAQGDHSEYEFIRVKKTSKNRSYAYPVNFQSGPLSALRCGMAWDGSDFKGTVWLRADAPEEEIRHELLHALGLAHEQQHLARDQYIDILRTDFDNTEWLINWETRLVGCPLGKFDFSSTMLYYNYSSVMGRKHSTLNTSMKQDAVIQASLNNGQNIRFRAIDGTDDARDNLTLNYRDGLNLYADPLVSGSSITSQNVHLGAHSAQWKLIPKIDGLGQPISHTYHIQGRWGSPLAGGGQPILFSNNGSLALIENTSVNRQNQNSEWVILPWLGGVLVMNREWNQKLHLAGGQASLIPNDFISSTIIEPVLPSYNIGEFPSAMDLFSVHVNFDKFGRIYNLDNARIKLKTISGGRVTAGTSWISNFWRFRLIDETPLQVTDNKGYLQIQDWVSGKYLHVNPNTGATEIIAGSDGLTLHGAQWVSSQWLIEADEDGTEGFIIRNRLTGSALSLSGENATAQDSSRWGIQFSGGNFSNEDTY